MVCHNTQGLFRKVVCFLFGQTLLLPGALPTQLQDFILTVVEFHRIPVGLFPPACLCPCGNPVLSYIDCWSLTIMTDIVVSSANPMRLLSVVDWSSLINILKRTCIRTDTCSVPLFIGLQVENLAHLWHFSKFNFFNFRGWRADKNRQIVHKTKWDLRLSSNSYSNSLEFILLINS